MPLVFNPFNPMSYVNAWSNSVTSAQLGRSRVPVNTPIPVEVRDSNRGLKTSVKQIGARTEVSFSGKATGPSRHEVLGGALNDYEKYYPISLSVAVKEAPTKDAMGRTNYTEVNKRSMVTSPKGGETGRAIAERFASQINTNLQAFRAVVKPGATPDAATLVITRR